MINRSINGSRRRNDAPCSKAQQQVCGLVVNPDTVVAQMPGGINFGIASAMYGEMTIKDGRVQQSNFNDYRPLRMDEAPAIEVGIVKSLERVGGIGEPGTSGVLAAFTTRSIPPPAGASIRSQSKPTSLQPPDLPTWIPEDLA